MTFARLRAVSLAAVCCAALPPLAAQVIPIKTIPMAQGNQFELFPSNNLGLGSVSIALNDSLGDPFENPATGSRLRASRFFSSPTIYALTKNVGGGRSLPVGMFVRMTNWFGAVSLALQSVDPSRPPQSNGDFVNFNNPLPPPPNALALTPPAPPGQIPGPDLSAHGNRYVLAMVGRSVPSRNLSVGASVFWNGLHAVDGVDLLYQGSRRVDQDGHSLDVRVGALKEWPGERGPRSLEAIVLHNRFATTHNVTFADAFWDPNLQQFFERARLERNFDRTNTWGTQLKFSMPVDTGGWRMGWLATINRATHPKIPTYDGVGIQAIPGDPGHSFAADLGVGFSKVRDGATFGLDAIYEPIRSYTWADAAAPTATASGDTIAVGGRTMDNAFRFSNAIFRAGVGKETPMNEPGKFWGFQVGLIVRSIRYTLRQTDHVQNLSQTLRSGWLEWTPTWGLGFTFPQFELRYRGQVTKGAGRPGQQFIVGVRGVALDNQSIIAAPSGPTFMTGVSTVTHQISLSLPLR